MVAQLRHFLLGVQERDNTVEIRRRRQASIDQIIGMLFNVAADIQREEWCGWSRNEGCELKLAQQLWLDPIGLKMTNGFVLSEKKMNGRLKLPMTSPCG